MGLRSRKHYSMLDTVCLRGTNSGRGWSGWFVHVPTTRSNVLNGHITNKIIEYDSNI